MNMYEPFIPDTRRCMRCVYFHGKADENCCCNYIFDRGHRRPCPPGKDCTVYRPRAGRRNLRNIPKRQRKEQAYEIQ